MYVSIKLFLVWSWVYYKCHPKEREAAVSLTDDEICYLYRTKNYTTYISYWLDLVAVKVEQAFQGSTRL